MAFPFWRAFTNWSAQHYSTHSEGWGTDQSRKEKVRFFIIKHENLLGARIACLPMQTLWGEAGRW